MQNLFSAVTGTQYFSLSIDGKLHILKLRRIGVSSKKKEKEVSLT